MESAELLCLAMEEVRLRFDVILFTQGLADLFFVAGEDVAHDVTGNDITIKLKTTSTNPS